MRGTEVRKLQETNGSLTLVIPRYMARALGMDRGDHVALEMWPKHIVIRRLDLHRALVVENSTKQENQER